MELLLSLSSADRRPMCQKIYVQIRDAALSGRLRPGQKLPSTRDIATRHEISRNTVVFAYERLLSEGFLEAKSGSGTYVTNLLLTPVGGKYGTKIRPPEPIALAESVRNLEKWVYSAPYQGLPYDFRQGIPALEYFPLATWRRIVARHFTRLAPDLARYDAPAGFRPLREAITSYVQRSRGVKCDPDQIVVTTGSQQAVDLLARLLILPGQSVVVENPCYPAAAAAFRAAGAKLCPVAVDDQGIQTSDLPGGARLLFVTPSHHHPTGAFLPLPRRLQLLRWALDHGTVIVEDDYDCEFRYGSRPVESLQGLDHSGLVVYVGTFSKVLFPGLRLGYVVLPASLIKPFLALKWIADRHTSGVVQRLMADFMLQDHFEWYMRKMRRVYEQRRESLLESLDQYAKDHIRIIPSLAGLHLAGWMKRKVDMTRLRNLAAEAGVGIYPLTRYFLERPRPGLLFGYSALSPEDIRRGIRRLGQILDNFAS